MPPDEYVASSEWYAALLEEYKSLRTEAVTARDAQLSILRVAVPLLAALIGLGVSLGQDEDKVVGGFLIVWSVPFVVGLTFEMWFAEVKRSVRAGVVVAAIERRLGKVFRPSDEAVAAALRPPMGWERWLRDNEATHHRFWKKRSQQQNESVISAVVIFAFLFVVTIVSTVLGFSYLSQSNDFPAMCETIIAVGLGYVYLIVRGGFAVRDINRRNEIPDEEEVWPFPDKSQDGK
jgi:hypothetical protein